MKAKIKMMADEMIKELRKNKRKLNYIKLITKHWILIRYSIVIYWITLYCDITFVQISLINIEHMNSFSFTLKLYI